ncbi:MAG: 2'-5' RNA ligase family protein, partial [Oscillospiraceae bacterium]|nr:2'-5' RNA ligase family protein [Oscillospiraceae bacterium]
EAGMTEHFRSFAKTLSPADIVFDKTGSFGNVVLFLPPAENGFLRSANKSLHDMMPFSPAEGGNYLPGKWVPHCSICVLLDEETFPAAYETAERMFSPIKGRITRLVLAECYPYREKMIIDL